MKNSAYQKVMVWVCILFVMLFSIYTGTAYSEVLNLAVGKTATASSVDGADTAAMAIDGNMTTQWGSVWAVDPQWIYVDLGGTATITEVQLEWESAYATSYKIQTSSNASDWTDVYTTTTGDGGNDTLTVSGSGRYVRMYGTVRATGYGYSLHEFEIYGSGVSALLSLGKTATASSVNGANVAAFAVDGSMPTRWESIWDVDPQWIYVDLAATYAITQVQLEWDTTYGQSYKIQTSEDASTWTDVYTTTTGNGGNDTITVSGSGRYIRMYGTVRGAGYGYSLWEVEIYGTISAAPTYKTAGTEVNGIGAITVAWPTHQSGDVALLVVESANQTISLSTPAGFAEVAAQQGTGTAAGTAATRLAVYWKRATTSAETSPVVADSGDHQIARIITFSGTIASGNPWDVTAGDVAASASTSVSIPAATTTVANTLVVAIAANATDTTTAQNSGWTNANLTSLTERIDSNTTTGNGGGFGVATGIKAAAGDYGAMTATLATSSVQGRMSIALKPPTPTSTPTPTPTPSPTPTPTPTPTPQTQNLAVGKTATASSVNGGNTAALAVDGSMITRWESEWAVDPQWIYVDLGGTATITQVQLEWESAAYATSYKIQTSSNAADWTDIYTTTTGNGGNDTLTVSGSGRYVRMYGTVRSAGYGYSLWEFKIYGSGVPALLSLGKTATASSVLDTNVAANAIDVLMTTKWESIWDVDPQWIYVDLAATYTITQVQLEWDSTYGQSYKIQTSANATDWTDVFSTTTGNGGNDTTSVSGSGRYVRMYGTVRGAGYGYALWEFEIYGNVATPSPTPTPTPEIISVSVSPSTWAIGIIPLSSVYEAGPYTITNNGNVAEDFDIKGANGAGGWTLSGSIGQNAFKVEVDKEDDGSYEIILTGTDQALYSNLAVSGTKNIGLKYSAPNSDTVGGGTAQGFNITITASKYIP